MEQFEDQGFTIRSSSSSNQNKNNDNDNRSSGKGTDNTTKNKTKKKKMKNTSDKKRGNMMDMESEEQEGEGKKKDEGMDDLNRFKRKCDVLVSWHHPDTVNRIRINPKMKWVCATMSANGCVYIWDTTMAMKKTNQLLREESNKSNNKNNNNNNNKDASSTSSGSNKLLCTNIGLKPYFRYAGHGIEGYALAWSPHDKGVLLTADVSGVVRLWTPNGKFWDIHGDYKHPGSVEDIAWSPVEAHVFATACTDGNLRIWDARDATQPKITIKAHHHHINVLSWCAVANNEHVLATGCEDGSFKIWDLTQIKPNKKPEAASSPSSSSCLITHSLEPIAHFRWHDKPITSLDWHPTDESVLMVSSADHRLSIWDLSLEKDDDPLNAQETNTDVKKKKKKKTQDISSLNNKSQSGTESYPVNLYFLHQGQRDLKEVSFHPELNGMCVSTAETGFQMFHPVNL